MDRLKKTGAALFSMKTAMAILALLLVVCLLGSLIPQGEPESYYYSKFGENISGAVLFLKLDNVFHAWWFVALAAFLCINLMGCNLLRFPGLIRRTKNGFDPEKRTDALTREESASFRGNAELLFRSMGFRNPVRTKTQSDMSALYAVRNRVGLWGAWLTHLGLFIIILGFSLGQIFMEKESVYGVKGQTKDVPGTDYELTIDSFETTLREDETVAQYISRVTVKEKSSEKSQSGEISVNHPLKLFGWKLYQNTTGWASDVHLYKGDEPELAETLCAGEIMTSVSVPKLQLLFSAFYPDYTEDENGMPSTASSALNNPSYLYALFYDEQLIGMNILKPGEYISVDDLSFVFENPRQYTLIQFKKDPFTFLVLIGGIVICAALVLAFYIRTEELLAVEDPEIPSGWNIYAKSRKGGVIFKEKLAVRISEMQEDSGQ